MPSSTAAWGILGISVLLLCAPLLLHGPLPQGSDVLSTTHYLQGFMKAFAEGDLFPRWTDRTNRELGAPSFVMLVPLTYYGAAAAVWLAGSLVSGIKLYLIVVAALSGLAFHALAREWIGPGIPAAVASGAYLLLPYHVLDMYQRFALSETTAFVYFPLILLFARRVLRGGAWWNVALLALSYAALVATHLVSGFFYSLFMGVWLLWESRGRWSRLPAAASAMCCGLLAAAPALLPALVEKQAANVAWLREMPNGDVRINFIFRDDPLPGLGIRDPVKPPVLRSAHSQLLLAGVGLIVALAFSRRGAGDAGRRDAVTMAAACAAAYLMQLEVSLPIWRLVPELATIQFPWRLQAIMVLSASLLTGYAAATLRPAGRSRRGSARAAGAALAVCLALNLWLAWRTAHLKPFTFDQAASAHPWIATWVEPAFTPTAFRSYREFKSMDVTLPRAAFVTGEGTVQTPAWLSSRRSLRIDSSTGGTVALRTFWFPGWAGTLDGGPLELKPLAPWAAIAFDVPPGSHAVDLVFGPTPSRRWGWALATAGMAAMAGLSWTRFRSGGAS